MQVPLYPATIFQSETDGEGISFVLYFRLSEGSKELPSHFLESIRVRLILFVMPSLPLYFSLILTVGIFVCQDYALGLYPGAMILCSSIGPELTAASNRVR